MHVDHLAGVAVGRTAAGVGGQADRIIRPSIDWREREPQRRPGLCGGRGFGGGPGLCGGLSLRGELQFGRSGRRGQSLGVAGEADARRATADGGRAAAACTAALCGRGDRLHPWRDLGPQKLPAQERGLHGAAASDDARVVHAESLANEEHDGGADGIDALRPIPADQLRREVGDPGIEKLKPTGGALVGNRRDHRLQRQRAVELIDAAEQFGQIAVAAGIA